MCGIIAAAGALDLSAAVTALTHRGPDASETVTVNGVTLGHTRLAIQDPTPGSDQPFQWGNLTLVYNGELFNTPTVRAVVEAARAVQWRTTGDTEVVAAALAVLGPAAALPLLDGMFALAWTTGDGALHLARDRGGEVPLHVHRAHPILAGSEVKAFLALGRRGGPAVVDVGPGEWWTVTGPHLHRRRFHTLTATPGPWTLTTAVPAVASALTAAVQRRAVSDVPVCSLLSGGIDSAAKLIEVPVPPPTADDLTRVIYHVEMNYKAQIEIGWPCLLLAAAIRSDGFRVTYTGEGSDELWASYGFAYHALRTQNWHTYRRDLILAQAHRNFPRVNKAFLAHGVEARLPFLDPDVVDLALSLPRDAVQDGSTRPKAVLQRAYTGRLPTQITTRPKVAFQDGLGLKTAVTRVLPNPGRYYRAEHHRMYG
jgi:asparagine synthase (glutamine-hydrolysing)